MKEGNKYFSHFFSETLEIITADWYNTHMIFPQRQKQRGINTLGLSAAAPWRAFYGNTPVSLDYPGLTMYQLLKRNAKQYLDHDAYVFMGKKTSYAEFLARIKSY